MENEFPNPPGEEEGKSSRRGRLMGKLFGRDRKGTNASIESNTQDSDVNDFLRSQGDKLAITHPGPPVLAKLDISSATRYPNALDVAGTPRGSLSLPRRPRSSRKNLVVRFVDTFPEIIGEGGDESEEPTFEISKKMKKRPPAVTAATAPAVPFDLLNKGPDGVPTLPQIRDLGETFTPSPLRRTQTGFSSVGEGREPTIPPGQNLAAKFLDSPIVSPDEKRRSFIEVHYSQMREAEGLALANARRDEDEPSSPETKHVHSEASKSAPQEPRAGPPPKPPAHSPPPPANLPAVPAAVGQAQQRQQSSPPQIQPHDPPPPPPQQAPPLVTPAQHAAPAPPEAQSRQPFNIDESPSSLYSTGSSLAHTPSAMYAGQPRQPAKNGSPAIGSGAFDPRMKQPIAEESPNSEYSLASGFSSAYSPSVQNAARRFADKDTTSPSSPMKSSQLREVVDAASEDALNTFATRTRHLFELFRLHAEQMKPLLSATPDDLARAGLWWFLKGRMALERAVRERPSSPQGQQRNEFARQQAYADLAKGYWISEEALPELLATKSSPVDGEVNEVRKTLISSLRKLSVSMQRNGFLPPEEAFLPQTINKAIWVEYPSLSQDITLLLQGNWSSALSQEQRPPSLALTEALPLGDTAHSFNYGRVPADVFLMEQGREAQRFYYPCLVSVGRPQNKHGLIFTVASQNGAIQLPIQGDKKGGATWDDVRWRPETSSLDIKLPRGFLLVVQCSQSDYSLLWNLFDFSENVQAALLPRPDETCIFRVTLRAFQYLDNDPQARQFPKEAVANCEISLFEKVLREGAATGPRHYHRGFRIAVVTGPMVKTLSGIDQTFSPLLPLQYGFLRGEGNSPALSLRFFNGRSKGDMVLCFNDEADRIFVHSLLIATAMRHDEQVFTEVGLSRLTVSQSLFDPVGLPALDELTPERVRIINGDMDNGSGAPQCVLSDRLRIVVEYPNGSMTDRVNVAPGELKMRLDVRDRTSLMLFRQPQEDMTLAVSEAHVSRELPLGLTQALDQLRQMATVRTYTFPTADELHYFQSGLTGFRILFDEVATGLAISRRRMVVPLHKKWEAGATRLQVVQQDKITQLLCFFSDFSHAQCMSLVLRGTDTYEALGRGARAGVRLVDAKFPLPPDNAAGAQPSDAAFVCLDLPELPGEHDDISITFDGEQVRDKFIQCLPAPVKAGSRLGKIKG